MIKVITFDLDDTLWQATPVLIKAEQAVYQWLTNTQPDLADHYSSESLRDLRNQLTATRPDLTHQITESRRLILQTVLERTGMHSALAATKADEGMAVFLEARHQVALFEVIEPLLEQLSNDFIIGALTNGNADIYRLEIGRYFDFAYSAEMLDSSKPQAPHFEKTEQRTGAKPSEILHIGDHIEHDIRPAIQRGWHTIWLKHKPIATAQEPAATVIIEDINDLPAAVSKVTDGYRQ